jgi:hypothetical protein
MPITIIEDQASKQMAQQWKKHSVSTNNIMLSLMSIALFGYVIGLVNLSPVFFILGMIATIKITCTLQVMRYKKQGGE